ncbi:MAG: polysaccharide deacetylase, partial [Paenibacillus sp.]|nr:polysaccharide deacetylase [Paenibacillus sp.]
MKTTRSGLLVLLLAIQLSACSAGIEAVTTNSETRQPTAAIQEQATIPSGTPSVTPAASPAETPMPSPEENVKVKPEYRMNAKTYRFEPIDQQSTDKVVLLTFDDGPNDEKILASMLDTLDRHGAKAIFFVNGYRVKQNPELLQLINDRGQTIGNHSYDHIDLKNEPEAVVEEQLSSVQKDVEALTGVVPRFFRPPYGSGSEFVRKTAQNHGMLYMTWSNGSLDWDKSAKDKP